MGEKFDKDRNIIYFDLDGVLADFNSKARQILGDDFNNVKPSIAWKALARPENDFFNSLDIIDDGLVIWDVCEGFNRVVLTGKPYGKWAAPQKKQWVARELGKEVMALVVMSKDKYKYCEPGDILIDDSPGQHKEPWEDAGGIFVSFDRNDCQAALNRMLELIR